MACFKNSDIWDMISLSNNGKREVVIWIKGKGSFLNIGWAILTHLLENLVGFKYNFCMTEAFSERSNALICNNFCPPNSY
jgi:hypothetical protein